MRVLRIIVTFLMLGSVVTCMVVAETTDRQASADLAYTLWLDTVHVYPGESVGFDINLTNSGPVGSFNLLIKYDPSAVWPVNLTLENTRAADFEYFEYTYNEAGRPGEVRLIGISELGAGPPLAATALPPGDGSLARITFTVANTLDLAGLYIPVRFVFHDTPINDDNTLTDDSGVKIGQTEIEYYDGFIAVREMGEVNLGDVNINGFAYEVSDYVYFSNYFENPNAYPMNALQLANSDMNLDHIPATISDLITLINKIMSGAKASQAAGGSYDLTATIESRSTQTATIVGYQTDFEVGGIFLALRTSQPVDLQSIENLNQNMSIRLLTEGAQTRLFIYSPDGHSMPAGSNDFLKINGLTGVEITSMDLAGADGRTAMVSFAPTAAPRPEDFTLFQNYPNPFNPATQIDFGLKVASDVRLTVYDLLGRQVMTLLDSRLDAGRHSTTWNGRDQNGQVVSSGVYFYRLKTPNSEETRKMILLK
ncbi:MAG: T9SS type A sorting domain-containing protein [candidate division Zixibacteria bacterium]|nr:T9SS type A sorting domain-containing protein [candidate division Zixibacteria bacterium]MDH3937862.1 T9SS type A sorting domain-containing protein [candidate division Zixibacteria bacterium]MDH4033330.1 T9SS type A sorting domain-containing protein [candidate division Zixibacteria bacterium]